jgi:hypothetical protein
MLMEHMGRRGWYGFVRVSQRRQAHSVGTFHLLGRRADFSSSSIEVIERDTGLIKKEERKGMKLINSPR